ncbi:MAG: hypothetical protein ABII10_00420 [Candidatus Paceibacterota bacterium]
MRSPEEETKEVLPGRVIEEVLLNQAISKRLIKSFKEVTIRVHKESGKTDNLGWEGLGVLEQTIIVFICTFGFDEAQRLADELTSESSRKHLYEFIDQWERKNKNLMWKLAELDSGIMKEIINIKRSLLSTSPSAQE